MLQFNHYCCITHPIWSNLC